MNPPAQLHWIENGIEQSVRWRSESGALPPRRVVLADDTMGADAAYRLACEGTALLWRGDFHNARQLLQALARRVDRKPRRHTRAGATPAEATEPSTPTQAFHRHRQAQAQRARVLGMLIVPLAADFCVPLRRAPDFRDACSEAWDADARTARDDEASAVSLRELSGVVGAHEWRKKGVEVASLGGPGHNRIHPHYGVFSPVRGEYVQLVAQAPLPSNTLAFDVGVGTGVLSAVLAHRGVQRVVATDQDPRALACARDNLQRLGLQEQVEVVQADLYAPLAAYGQAPLIVCNPPWVPARASTPVEHAVYDPDSRMLRGFLDGLAAHLAPQGEGWLVLSDLAEHLGLRPREQLLGWIESAGLAVRGRLDVRPRHPKAGDASDPLHAARAAEVTSLWRLGHRQQS